MSASDEANKIETVLNNPLQFKIPVYVLNRSENAHDIIIIVFDVTDKESSNNVKGRMGEIDKHVSDGINKLLIEHKLEAPAWRLLRGAVQCCGQRWTENSTTWCLLVGIISVWNPWICAGSFPMFERAACLV